MIRPPSTSNQRERRRGRPCREWYSAVTPTPVAVRTVADMERPDPSRARRRARLRSGSSSPPDGPGSPRSRPGLPVFGSDRRRCLGCAARRPPCSPGISSEYYIRLERGDATGISEGVVDGIVHALQLDDAERSHLLDLLRTASSTQPPAARAPTVQRVRPDRSSGMLDSMVDMPAVRAQRPSRRARLQPARPRPVRTRSTTTSPTRRTTPASSSSTHAPTQFCRDWDKAANDTVAILRTEAGRDPYDREPRAGRPGEPG